MFHIKSLKLATREEIAYDGLEGITLEGNLHIMGKLNFIILAIIIHFKHFGNGLLINFNNP